MARTEKNDGTPARIWTLDNGDKVSAIKTAGQWQPTYQIVWAGQGGGWTTIQEPVQSTALWTLSDLKALCAQPADEVRRALVGGAS